MRLLVVTHHAGDHLGRLAPRARAAGVRVTECFAPAGNWPAMDAFDALVVMGGAMQVWETGAHPWLEGEGEFIRAALRDHAKPYLGICFGHQLLAHALGGEVGPARHPEIGVLGVAAGGPLLPKATMAAQWHSAEVLRPPDGFEVGASSTACAIQSLHGPHAVHSVQFHPEVTRDTVLAWVDWPETLPDMPETEKAALRRDYGDAMDRHEAVLDRLAEDVFDGWWREVVARGAC